MKISIEWDIAWRIFDHVNENNDTKKHIDLNCLDINEACYIAKQQIYEVAKCVLPPKNKPGFLDNLLCGMLTKSEEEYRKDLLGHHNVLCIEYGDDHGISGPGQDGGHKMNSEMKQSN